MEDGPRAPALGLGASPQRLYVYYRVPEAQLAAVLAQVGVLQQRLMASHPGLQAEVLRRPELRDGEVTLMEAYAETRPGALGDGFIAALAQAASALPQPRHTERFTRLA